MHVNTNTVWIDVLNQFCNHLLFIQSAISNKQGRLKTTVPSTCEFFFSCVICKLQVQQMNDTCNIFSHTACAMCKEKKTLQISYKIKFFWKWTWIVGTCTDKFTVFFVVIRNGSRFGYKQNWIACIWILHIFYLEEGVCANGHRQLNWNAAK